MLNLSWTDQILDEETTIYNNHICENENAVNIDVL